MSENKTGKYLKYALGEILLVMVGILLALQVNNWNEGRKAEKEVKTQIINLIENIKSDISRYNAIIDGTKFRYNSITHLIKLANLPVPNDSYESLEPKEMKGYYDDWQKPFPEDYDMVFVRLVFSRSVRDINIQTNRIAIEEMKSSGLFASIKSNDIKEAIHNYYSVADWRLGEHEAVRVIETVNRWKVSLGKLGVIPQDISMLEDPLQTLRNDPERFAILLALRRHAGFRIQSLIRLEERATDLISLLDNHVLEYD